MNTADGQTVEPLPFGAMSGYPYPPSETYPSLAVHRDYLDIYQTRRQHPAEFWRRLSRPELNGVEAER